jgi:hypothetical protein
MKVVIQCSAAKAEGAGTFRLDGRPVKFVAHPECYSASASELPFRPDDTIPSTSTTWREHLVEYNRGGGNPDGLFQAGKLYRPKIYQRLLDHVGIGNLFILSAGWGLIKADFLLPQYDITFARAEPWKRRRARDEFHDYAQLTQAGLSADESVYFFGGKEYLSLYYRLTENLTARKVVYFAADQIPINESFEYIPYGQGGINWHYRCARESSTAGLPGSF